MKKILLPLLVSTLAGCGGAVPREVPFDTFLVDTKMEVMCYKRECFRLDLVIPSFDEMDVARAYGLPSGLYSWNTRQFLNLLISPPNGLYPVTQLSDTEFQLPVNKATKAAFTLLEEEYLLIKKIDS